MAWKPANGIKQGCLASGTIFALALDPFVRMKCLKLPKPLNTNTAFADDLAVVASCPGVGSVSRVQSKCHGPVTTNPKHILTHSEGGSQRFQALQNKLTGQYDHSQELVPWFYRYPHTPRAYPHTPLSDAAEQVP